MYVSEYTNNYSYVGTSVTFVLAIVTASSAAFLANTSGFWPLLPNE